MRASLISIFFSLLMMLASCEERTGYLDTEQQNTIAMLTDVEWLIEYAEYWNGNEETFDDETIIYSFGRDTKGWTAAASLKDPSVKKNVQYFQWTFTNKNFVVIYMTGSAGEGYWDGYWLIEKLTPTEMWAQWSAMDPVLYPNQITTFYKLKARKRSV